MATKQLTVVRPGRYGTRMLQAGDSLECSGPDARLYLKLGWAAERAKPYLRLAVEAAKPKVAKIVSDAVSEIADKQDLSDPLNIPAASEEALVEAAKPAKRRRRRKAAE